MSVDAWLSTTLGEIAEFGNGGAWNQDEYTSDGIRVVRVSDIHGDTIDLSECRYLSAAVLDRYGKHQLRTGDLIICTVGSHPTQPASVVGRAVVVPRSADGALLNQNAVRLRPAIRSVDAGWLGFLGRSRRFHEYIIKCAGGAASQVRMPIGLLKEMPIVVPPLPTQRRIASILSAYDDLIENNTRRIEILEEMARRIYEEWFVRFRFPGHEGVRMLESELGVVPEGWTIARLGLVCSRMSSGNTPSRSNPDYWQSGTVDWFKTKELWDGYLFDSEERVSELAVVDKKTRTFPAGTILMAIYGSPTVGRLGITTRRAACNQAALGMLPDTDQITFWMLYYTLLAQRGEFNNKAQGAAQQNISKEKVAEATFVLPARDVQQRFNDVVDPMQTMLRNLQERNRLLRTTRDLLLPKLISGELDVSALPDPEVVAA